MYRGRYKLGQELILGLMCRDGSGSPVLPDRAPTLDVWVGASHPVSGKAIPVMDRFGATGLFQYPLFLGGDFITGQGTAVYRYQVGGDWLEEEDTFEITAGGDIDGQVIAMHYYPRPHANFLVWQTTSGNIIKGRNPRL